VANSLSFFCNGRVGFIDWLGVSLLRATLPRYRGLTENLFLRFRADEFLKARMKDARSHLAAMSFDALISDLNPPDGGGLDLVAEAKRVYALKAIAVTARTEVTEQERGRRAGCDFYLTKPVDFRQLRSALGIPLHNVRKTR
jgi:two-component system, NtrC family, response regulator PilR